MTRGPDRKVTRAQVYDKMQPGLPHTPSQLSEHFDCHPDTVYDRLTELYELDKIETKQVGGRSRVWWIPQPDDSIDLDSITHDMIEYGGDNGERDYNIFRVLAEAKRKNEPVTSKYVSREIDETQGITYNRLRSLTERGYVKSLKCGSTSMVWWLADKPRELDVIKSEEALRADADATSDTEETHAD